MGVEKFVDSATDTLSDEKSLWSLGVTTGKRFSWSGLREQDPLWTLSVRGQLNFDDTRSEDFSFGNQSWYFSPGLHWQRDSFKLSADVLMPFMQTGDADEDADYSIRARIQKKF